MVKTNSLSFTSRSMKIIKLLTNKGGGLDVPTIFFYFLTKNLSPMPDQTLRPTCKFLILGIFYHTIFVSRKI